MDTKTFARSTLDFARRYTLHLVEDFTDDELKQPPCKDGNPPIWLLGHVAVSEAELVGMAGGKPPAVPKGWSDLFGTGKRPPKDAKKYPDREALLAFLKEARNAALNFLHGLPEKDLAKPLPDAAPKEIREFVPNLGGLFGLLVNHEASHAGGIAVARRALGKKTLF